MLDDEDGQSQPFLFDLDPPRGRRQHIVAIMLWLAVAVLLSIPLRLFLFDDGTASRMASAPSTGGLAELCSQFVLPSVLRQIAGLAYPIWNNVCNLVGR